MTWVRKGVYTSYTSFGNGPLEYRDDIARRDLDDQIQRALFFVSFDLQNRRVTVDLQFEVLLFRHDWIVSDSLSTEGSTTNGIHRND